MILNFNKRNEVNYSIEYAQKLLNMTQLNLKNLILQYHLKNVVFEYFLSFPKNFSINSLLNSMHMVRFLLRIQIPKFLNHLLILLFLLLTLIQKLR